MSVQQTKPADTSGVTMTENGVDPAVAPVDGPRPTTTLTESKKSKKRKRKDTEKDAPEEEKVFCTPWESLVGGLECESVEQRLHYEIVTFTNWVRSTDQETVARQRVLLCIERIVQRRFRDAKISAFGSSSTGLSLPHADIDVVLSSRKLSDPDNQKKFLFQLSAAFRNAGITTFEKTSVTHRAKVPIVQFTTLPEFGSFDIDIGINNTDGLTGVEVINGFIEKLPALKPLVLVVKGMLKQRNLGDAAFSGLGSYSTTLMCISFLQLNPGQRDQADIDNPFDRESLGRLLMDFLVYYGSDFPYATSYISVKEGKLLPKDGEDNDWFSNKDPEKLVIQCPCNPQRDVSSSLKKLNEIRTAFKEAATILIKASASDSNLLAHVVQVEQKMVEQRATIAQLVESGALDRQIVAIGLGPNSSHYNRSEYRGHYNAPPSYHRDEYNRDGQYPSQRRDQHYSRPYHDRDRPSYSDRDRDHGTGSTGHPPPPAPLRFQRHPEQPPSHRIYERGARDRSRSDAQTAGAAPTKPSLLQRISMDEPSGSGTGSQSSKDGGGNDGRGHTGSRAQGGRGGRRSHGEGGRNEGGGISSRRDDRDR